MARASFIAGQPAGPDSSGQLTGWREFMNSLPVSCNQVDGFTESIIACGDPSLAEVGYHPVYLEASASTITEAVRTAQNIITRAEELLKWFGYEAKTHFNTGIGLNAFLSRGFEDVSIVFQLDPISGLSVLAAKSVNYNAGDISSGDRIIQEDRATSEILAIDLQQSIVSPDNNQIYKRRVKLLKTLVDEFSCSVEEAEAALPRAREAVAEVVRDIKISALEIPSRKYAPREDNIVSFLSETWGEWLALDALTQPILLKHDGKAYNALNHYLRTHRSLPDGMNIPSRAELIARDISDPKKVREAHRIAKAASRMAPP